MKSEQLRKTIWRATHGRLKAEREREKDLRLKVLKIDALIEEAANRGEDNLKWNGVHTFKSSGNNVYPEYSLLEYVRDHYGRLGFDTCIHNVISTTPYVLIDWYHRDPLGLS